MQQGKRGAILGRPGQYSVDERNVLDGVVSLPLRTLSRYCGYVLGLTSLLTEVSRKHVGMAK